MSIKIPHMFSDYHTFKEFVQQNLDGLYGHGKGDPWQEFCKNLVPLTDLGRRFPYLKDNSRKTRDGGWDIIGETNDGRESLYIQCKYNVSDINTFDGVISSWASIVGLSNGQMTLEGMVNERSDLHFCIITLNDLNSQIIGRYTKSNRAGIYHYKRWVDQGRLSIIDGPMIWHLLKDLYIKAYTPSKPQILSFVSGYVTFNNVYLGIVADSEIRRIHRENGDAIFFENVRDFIGASTDVNQEIAVTVREQPDQLLALNNGIVFSASKVELLDANTLKLDTASIVNGCQTTITLVNTSPEKECYLQVKIVQTDEHRGNWQVTRAANFQNEIKKIDLDLARFIRPQLVRKMGFEADTPIKSDNPLDILDTLTRTNITWRNVRILFIGLFSRDPGNMFDVRWDLVNKDLLNLFFQDEEKQKLAFEVVFELHKAAERGAEKTRQWLDAETRDIFRRLLGDTRSPYMQFLSILATCAYVDENVAQREESLTREADRMERILRKFARALEERGDDLDNAYYVAFEKISGDVLDQSSDDDAVLRKMMYNRITQQKKFTNLFRQVKIGIARLGRRE